MLKVIEIVEKYSLYLVVFLVPLAIIPVFPNYFVTIKIILLVVGVLVALLAKVLKMLVTGKLEIRVSKFDLPLLIIAVGYLVSSFVVTPNKMEAFFLPGTATIMIASFVLYFLINQLGKKDKVMLLIPLVISGILVSLVSLAAVTNIFSSISSLPVIVKQPGFTTLGGNLPAAIFLAVLIPLALAQIVKVKDASYKALWGISLGFIFLGLLGNIFNLLPGKPTSPKFASFATHWSINIDTIKESPILGVGPGNYLTAFNRFRPLEYNTTDLWAFKFTNARSYMMTLTTETGLLGMAGLILLAIVVYRVYQSDVQSKSESNKSYATKLNFLALLVSFALLALTIASVSVILLFFVVLAINSKTKKIILNLSAQGLGSDYENAPAQGFASKLPSILVSVPIVVIAGFIIYYGVTAVPAEATYKKALDALALNDGTQTYQLMRQAAAQNPFVDRYHSSLAQVNLALANSVAQKPEGEEITDEDRATITQLIQQSIAEGKATVSLNPPRAGTWELLGGIYRSVMPFAQGADQFAVQSYSQAIALDPINPNLRIALGGIYYALGDYDSAIETFRLAVIAKPDLPNSHYNLAVAYREKGEIDKAIEQMTIVLSLVDRDSSDYELAKSELENLEARRPAQEVAEGEELIPPEEQEPVFEPPIDLPEEAQPPEPEVTPSPSPTATPEENVDGEEVSDTPPPDPTPTIEP
ncbi:tetratricopeptide repeat protein [Patescibacteria group bacterium]